MHALIDFSTFVLFCACSNEDYSMAVQMSARLIKVRLGILFDHDNYYVIANNSEFEVEFRTDWDGL